MMATLSIQIQAAPVSLATPGSPYTQDFHTLAMSGTGSSGLPEGWLFSELGSSANATYRAGTGSGNTGDTYSFGAASSSERAFGILHSGSVASTIGAGFQNNLGFTIGDLRINYAGEQWRLGTSGHNPNRLAFEYSLDATSLTTGTWISFGALDFTSPITSGTAGALDGNAAGNRTLASATITGLSLDPGTAFWVRWNEIITTGAADGLAVDDFSLLAEAAPLPQNLPEVLPLGVAAAALLTLMVAGFARRRLAACPATA